MNSLPFGKWFVYFCLAALLVGVLMQGCGGDDETSTAPDNAIETVVKDAGTYPVVTPMDTITASDPYQVVDDAGTWVCTRETYSVVKAPDDYAIFNPNAEMMYPGCMLQGASLAYATPEPIAVQRGGGTVVINIANGSAIVYDSVDEVNQATIMQSLNDILAANEGIIPANFVFRSEAIHSREQMALAMGVNVDTWTFDVDASLSFSTEHEYNRFLVILNQGFYTMSFLWPNSISEFFGPGVTAADLERFVWPGNPATYISSITYGRRFYLLVESTAHRDDIASAISMTYSGAVDVNVDLQVNYVKELENSKVKVFAVGGDQSLALATFNGDPGALQEYLTSGASILNGVPLSFVVRNVVDNTIVNVKVASDYDVVTCELMQPGTISSSFTQSLEGWGIYGDFCSPIHITEESTGGEAWLWSRRIDGPFIFAKEVGGTASSSFRAPDIYHGDWTAFYGGTLSFYLWVLRPGGGDLGVGPGVFIDNVSVGTLEYSIPLEDYPSEEGWKYYLISLEPGEGWNFEGEPASQNDFEAVFANVTDFRIRCEYFEGYDEGALDEVMVVIPGLAPAGLDNP